MQHGGSGHGHQLLPAPNQVNRRKHLGFQLVCRIGKDYANLQGSCVGIEHVRYIGDRPAPVAVGKRGQRDPG